MQRLPSLRASPLPAATVGVAYSSQFAASGGSGTYTWSGSSLPSLADSFFQWSAFRYAACCGTSFVYRDCGGCVGKSEYRLVHSAGERNGHDQHHFAANSSDGGCHLLATVRSLWWLGRLYLERVQLAGVALAESGRLTFRNAAWRWHGNFHGDGDGFVAAIRERHFQLDGEFGGNYQQCVAVGPGNLRERLLGAVHGIGRHDDLYLDRNKLACRVYAFVRRIALWHAYGRRPSFIRHPSYRQPQQFCERYF